VRAFTGPHARWSIVLTEEAKGLFDALPETFPWFRRFCWQSKAGGYEFMGWRPDLRRYQGFGQPCSEEVVRIEALLAGMPAEQCVTEAEKRRRARQEERRRWEERSQERERQRAGDVPRRARSEDRDILWEILSGTMTKHQRGELSKARVREILHNAWRNHPAGDRRLRGQVIEGPWGDAS
jgi:hypothetical protein